MSGACRKAENVFDTCFDKNIKKMRTDIVVNLNPHTPK